RCTPKTADPIDTHLGDLRRMFGLGRIEILPVDDDRAGCIRGYYIGDLLDLGAGRSVLGAPADPVADHAMATAGAAVIGIDAERDTKLVLTHAHYERILTQRHGGHSHLLGLHRCTH